MMSGKEKFISLEFLERNLLCFLYMSNSSEVKKAKDFYLSVKQVLCPALNNEVIVFTMTGFNHLIRKGRILRSHADRMRRFKLLKYIKPITENAVKISEHRIEFRDEVIMRYGKKIKNRQIVEFWAIQKTHDEKNITILIRRIGNGQKHFFSVMSENCKQKIPHQRGSLLCLPSASMPIETDVSQAQR